MLGIVARYADEWNMWGLADTIAERAAVLDEHCERIGRDPARDQALRPGPVPRHRRRGQGQGLPRGHRPPRRRGHGRRDRRGRRRRGRRSAWTRSSSPTSPWARARTASTASTSSSSRSPRSSGSGTVRRPGRRAVHAVRIAHSSAAAVIRSSRRVFHRVVVVPVPLGGHRQGPLQLPIRLGPRAVLGAEAVPDVRQPVRGWFVTELSHVHVHPAPVGPVGASPNCGRWHGPRHVVPQRCHAGCERHRRRARPAIASAASRSDTRDLDVDDVTWPRVTGATVDPTWSIRSAAEPRRPRRHTGSTVGPARRRQIG